MVSALVSGSSGPGWNPGRGHCVVFMGKTLKVPLTPNFFFLLSKRIHNLVKIKKRID